MSKVKCYDLFRDKLHSHRKIALIVFRKKWIAVLASFVAAVVLMAAISVLAVSLSIKKVTSERIITSEVVKRLEDVDCIIVLGAGLRPDGTPSDMLEDRLLTGISLVQGGFDGFMILSGDNSGEHYNEVGAMLEYTLSAGVPENMIINDDYGFSTYESIYRAKHEYGAERIVIVTQGYHLHRALYIARELGVEAYGVSADLRSYRGQTYRDLREHIARLKDFLVCLISEE